MSPRKKTNNLTAIDMYHLFKEDPWRNKVPYMTVSRKEVADKLLKDGKDFITDVVNVPRSKSTILMM